MRLATVVRDATDSDIDALLDRLAVTDTIGMHLVTSVVCVDLGDD